MRLKIANRVMVIGSLLAGISFSVSGFCYFGYICWGYFSWNDQVVTRFVWIGFVFVYLAVFPRAITLIYNFAKKAGYEEQALKQQWYFKFTIEEIQK